MTQPVAHGYPDYGRYSARSDVRLLNVVNQASDPGPIYNLGFVGGVEAIGINISTLIAGAFFDINFYGDVAYTDLFEGYTVTLPTGTNARRILPILGPFARIAVNASGVNGTHSISAWTSNRSAIAQQGASALNVLVAQTATNIVAGATSTFTSTQVWPGAAFWTVTSTAATWRARLEHRNSVGGGTAMDTMQSAGQITLSHLVYLPFRAMQLVITNTSAAAANFDAYLVTRPIEPGA